MRKLAIFGLVGAMTLVLTVSGAFAAEDQGSLRFETTVPFITGKIVALNATVGPVKVRSVELSQQSGGGSGVESVVEKIRGGGGGASETQTTLRAAFDTENPKEDEWVVTYTLDFLDKDGKLIDRVSKKEGFEGEAKVYRFDHPILQYVVPFISKVKIQLEARYD
jgi:hypothetical protein